MVRSAWIHGAGPGVAALALIGWLAATGQGAVGSAMGPAACAGRATDAVAARVAQAPAAARVGDAPTLRLQPVLDRDGALSGQRLVIGRADGTGRRSIELAAESFAAGPFGQVVLVGDDDGIVSRAIGRRRGRRMLDAAGQLDRRHPDRDTQPGRPIAVRVPGRSRVAGRPGRVAAIRVAGGRAGPARRADPDGRAVRPDMVDLARLERRRPATGDPVVRGAGMSDAADRPADRCDDDRGRHRPGPIVGVADGRLVTYLACRGLPCPIVAVDLATGARQILAADGGQAVLVRTEAGPRLVHERGAGPRATLRSIALDGTGARELGPLPDGLGLVGSVDGSQVTAAIPAGWFLLAPTDATADARRPVRHPSATCPMGRRSACRG